MPPPVPLSRGETVTLRSAKSEESLTSQASLTGLATGADDAPPAALPLGWKGTGAGFGVGIKSSWPRGLDFDPLTYQCSPPVPQPSLSDDSSSASPVAALSPCSHPNVSQDASETPVSLPDKVLEMFSGGSPGAELRLI
ncbi:hypothetical protein E2320_000554 [Naja naja]|nr:hypothetical protein E2320_000554 [Naja naja]